MAFTPPLSLTNPTGTGQLTNQVTTAFEQIAYFALRSQPLYEMVADVRSTAQSHNAATVQFTFYPNMSQVTSTLTEATDVTPVALSDSKVDVALAEYGSSVITTALIRGTSFLNVDADAANIIGYNMVDSIDKVVSNVIMAGTNVIYAQGSMGSRPTARTGIADAAVYGANEGRMAVAQLRGDSAPGWENGNYMAIIHPDVSYDLRGDTAVTDVIQYQLYQDGAPIVQARSARSTVSTILRTLGLPYWMMLVLPVQPTFTRPLLWVVKLWQRLSAVHQASRATKHRIRSCD